MVPRALVACSRREHGCRGCVTSCGYGLPGRVRAYFPVKDDAQTTTSCPMWLVDKPIVGQCGGKSIDDSSCSQVLLSQRFAQMAKQGGVRGWHSMRKDQLVKALLAAAKTKTTVNGTKKSAPASGRSNGQGPHAGCRQPKNGQHARAAAPRPSQSQVGTHQEPGVRERQRQERRSKSGSWSWSAIPSGCTPIGKSSGRASSVCRPR